MHPPAPTTPGRTAVTVVNIFDSLRVSTWPAHGHNGGYAITKLRRVNRRGPGG